MPINIQKCYLFYNSIRNENLLAISVHYFEIFNRSRHVRFSNFKIWMDLFES
jgi:hypothetical protein